MSGAARGLAMSAILVATFANYLTFTVLTVALGPVGDEFHASLDDVAWVTIAPALVSGLLTPAFGSLGDRIGRARVFRLGLGLFTLGTLAAAVAPSLAMLILARVLTGVGSAAAMPTGIALATDLYPPERRATPMGYWTMVTALAPALGVLGGPIIEWMSWRALFAVQLPFALIALLVSLRYVPESRGSGEGRFDYVGATLLGASFFLLTLAANRASHWGLTSTPVIAAVGVGGAMLVSVLPIERRDASPVDPLETLRDHIVRASLAGRSLMYAVHMGSFLLLPVFLRDLRGLGPAAISWVLLPRPLAMGLAAPLSARLTRRFAPAGIVILGVSAMLLGVGSLLLVGTRGGTSELLPSLVLMGFGLGFTQTVTATEITERTPPDDLGTSAAMLAIATALSGSLGSAVLLALATRPGVPRIDAYRDAFLASTLLCVIALAVAVRRAMYGRGR